MTQDDFETRFAPVFALKAAAGPISPEAKPLKSQERQRNWEALMVALRSVLSKCSGIDLHPDNADYPSPLRLWDFLNGREILVSCNKKGGYDLCITTENGVWTETQLPLDLIMLKLLELDYTPEELRAFLAKDRRLK